MCITCMCWLGYFRLGQSTELLRQAREKQHGYEGQIVLVKTEELPLALAQPFDRCQGLFALTLWLQAVLMKSPSTSPTTQTGGRRGVQPVQHTGMQWLSHGMQQRLGLLRRVKS